MTTRVAGKVVEGLVGALLVAGCAESRAALPTDPLPWPGGVVVDGRDPDGAPGAVRTDGLVPGGLFGSSLATLDRGPEGSLVFVGARGGDGGAGLIFGFSVPRPDGSVPSSTDEALARWRGEAPGDAAGSALASVGDIDGDGQGDLAVGAWRADHRAGEDAGAVYVLTDPTRGGDLDAAPIVVEGAPGEALGFALPGRLDVDGDGRDDLVLPAFHAGGGDETSAGAVYVFHGPLSPGRRTTADADAVVRGAPRDHLGLAAVAGGDPDGDGNHALVVAAPFAPGVDGTPQGGATYWLPGPIRPGDAIDLAGDAVDGVVWRGVLVEEQSGSELVVCQGPRPDDLRLWVSAPGIAPETGGRIVAVRPPRPRGGLRALDLGTGDRQLLGRPGEGLGAALLPVPDLDGDGWDELLVAAPSGGSGGRVHLVSGNPALGDAPERLGGPTPGTDDPYLEVDAPGVFFGSSLAVTPSGWLVAGALGGDEPVANGGAIYWLRLD